MLSLHVLWIVPVADYRRVSRGLVLWQERSQANRLPLSLQSVVLQHGFQPKVLEDRDSISLLGFLKINQNTFLEKPITTASYSVVYSRCILGYYIIGYCCWRIRLLLYVGSLQFLLWWALMWTEQTLEMVSSRRHQHLFNKFKL